MSAHEICFRFQVFCSISERRPLKGEWCQNGSQISHFLTPSVKIGGGVGYISGSINPASPATEHLMMSSARLVRTVSRRKTSISAIAERPRCKVGQFWVDGGWYTGGWSSVRQYSAPNVVDARKLKALIFYTINPLLHEKRSLCVFEPLFEGEEA